MTSPTRLERTLPTILDELAAGPTPEYLDDVSSSRIVGRVRSRRVGEVMPPVLP